MLKQTVEYDDIDGETTTATLWFHLNNLEIAKDMELETLEARFKKFQDEVYADGVERKLSPSEIREMYRMLEILVKASFGRRYGADNKFFSKDPTVWKEFNDSGQYDGFMKWLFGDGGARANAFFENIWPKDLREAYQDEQRRERFRVVEDIKLPDEGYSETPDTNKIAPDDNVPSITSLVEERGLGEYSDKEIISMGDEQFVALVERSRQGNNVPSRLLVLGFQRNKESTTE